MVWGSCILCVPPASRGKWTQAVYYLITTPDNFHIRTGCGFPGIARMPVTLMLSVTERHRVPHHVLLHGPLVWQLRKC
jgi:hypothetical protein